jgi:hypothetical protein
VARQLRRRLVAAELAGQQPARDGAPHLHAHALVDRDGQQFIFRFPRLDGVVDLLGTKRCQLWRSDAISAFMMCQPEKLEHAG